MDTTPEPNPTFQARRELHRLVDVLPADLPLLDAYAMLLRRWVPGATPPQAPAPDAGERS